MTGQEQEQGEYPAMLVMLGDIMRPDSLERRSDGGEWCLKFATSLVEAFNGGRGITDRQLATLKKKWTEHRAMEAAALAPPDDPPPMDPAPAAAPARPVIASAEGIDALRDLFDRAARHLKRPALECRILQRTIEVRRAPDNGQNPGCLYVRQEMPDNPGFLTYVGKIERTGGFVKDRKVDDADVTGLVPRLVLFAKAPARLAAEHGRLTGKCCFCNLPLTDERSTAEGYGPKCAKNWGLPWGGRSGTAELVAEATA